MELNVLKNFGNGTCACGKKHIFDSNHYETAMEMAKWKEQQMIEKAVKWLYEHALDFNENGQKFYEQQQLIEKFKQAMEE